MLVTEQWTRCARWEQIPAGSWWCPACWLVVNHASLLTAIMDFIGLLGGCVASVFSCG
jgi:hypothetical protein